MKITEEEIKKTFDSFNSEVCKNILYFMDKDNKNENYNKEWTLEKCFIKHVKVLINKL